MHFSFKVFASICKAYNQAGLNFLAKFILTDNIAA
jgi:hypothetical protein